MSQQGQGSQGSRQSQESQRSQETQQRQERQHRDRRERLRSASVRFRSVVSQLVVAALVLVTFVGMAYLVFIGRLVAEPLVFYAGVIIGYVARAGRELL